MIGTSKNPGFTLVTSASTHPVWTTKVFIPGCLSTRARHGGCSTTPRYRYVRHVFARSPSVWSAVAQGSSPRPARATKHPIANTKQATTFREFSTHWRRDATSGASVSRSELPYMACRAQRRHLASVSAVVACSTETTSVSASTKMLYQNALPKLLPSEFVHRI